VTDNWKPCADLQALRARAGLLHAVRDFFDHRGVLEVETPLLGQFPVTDPQMEPLCSGDRYLQTSPEYAMKRLLAAGSGPIFQVSKAFRAGECGARHNPEFSLLEWYRPGFEQHQLMEEVAQLVMQVTGFDSWEACSYGQLFQDYLAVDPHQASAEELADCAGQRLETSFDGAGRDTWLDLLLSHVIEPQLAGRGLLFIYDYPESQAALSRLRPIGSYKVGERFELYAAGMELANGFFELTDAVEQQQRFQRDQQQLAKSGQSHRAIDHRLIAALQAGLPECSGVALGLDRLLMLCLGRDRISEVLAFDWHGA